MAKTFKNLPQPESAATARRASERDYFDLTDDTQPSSQAEMTLVIDATPVTTETGTTGNHHHPDNTGNTHNTINTTTKKRADTANRSGGSSNIATIDNTSITFRSPLPNSSVIKENSGTEGPVVQGRDVRQTFVLSLGHLEQLRDHVHARRVGGDYNYSQKQALQEALDLLFASTAPVSPRPEQVRQLEQQRREKIQQGRQSRT